jgi:4-nitrophenyl phosphatase
MNSFTNIRALIIDMDGVLWHGDHAQTGLVEFFQTLRDLKLPFVLATNNASLTAGQYVEKLHSMGVSVGLQEILTSGMATALYLSRYYSPQQSRVFVIGGVGAKQPLLDLGFTLTDLYESGPEQGADLVVCGLDKELSWHKLATATLNIQAGAGFYATNGDTSLPTERGIAPGNGATLAALQAVTGVTPTIIGKPEPVIYQQAMALLGEDMNYTIAIGDRLDTDILGAVRTGIRSLMVLSGISSKADIAKVEYGPDWVVNDIRDVTRLLRESHITDQCSGS